MPININNFRTEEAPDIAENIPNATQDSDDEARQPVSDVEEDPGEAGDDPLVANIMASYDLEDDQAADVRDLIYRWGLEEQDAVERVRRSATV